MARTAPRVELSETEKSQLRTLLRRTTAPLRSVVRARILLGAAEGQENQAIAATLKLRPATVSKVRAFCHAASGRPGRRAPFRARRTGGALTGFAHEYTRHGTSTLFAALTVATGQVQVDHYTRRRRVEFLDFMN
jgi:hypothetical protein